MDPHAFDRATRLFRTPHSRRSAWHALLGAALLGTTMRTASAAPCGNDRHGCGTGNECCPGKCFRSVRTSDELCCSGPDLIICENRCCQNVGEDPCDCCLDPGATTEIAAAANSCPGAIAGSYRRR
jgi:hypothetical protein